MVISLLCKVLQDAEFAEMSAKLPFKLVKKAFNLENKTKNVLHHSTFILQKQPFFAIVNFEEHVGKLEIDTRLTLLQTVILKNKITNILRFILYGIQYK